MIILTKTTDPIPQINTVEEVKAFFARLMFVEGLGAGFHPDTPLTDYVDEDDVPTFNARRALNLQSGLDQCFAVYESLTEDIYALMIEEQMWILLEAHKDVARKMFQDQMDYGVSACEVKGDQVKYVDPLTLPSDIKK